MADRPKILVESGLQFTGTQWIGTYRVPQWTTSDTTTLSDFVSFTTVTVYRADTGASVTSTNSANVITLTQAAMSNVTCYVFVSGIR